MTEGEFSSSPPGAGDLSLENSVTDSSDSTVTASADRYSPLHARHVAAGASFTDFAGWRMPVRYSSDLAEHHAVRTAAGLFDLSHMAEIVILGPEAADALDYALAGRISAVAIGQAKYSLLLGREGGIVDDLVAYRTGDDRFLIVANASNREVVAEQLRERCSPFDCQVFDESDDVALIAIQGPKAYEILSQVPGVNVPGLDELKYYWSTPGTFKPAGEQHEMLIARTGYTGEDGFELYVAPNVAPLLWDAILDTGEGAGLVPAGLASRDTLRLEAGMPLYGHELGLDTYPSQAGLGRVVTLTKEGDFVGRAAVEAGASSGARVLVGLVSEGKRAGRAGYEVYTTPDPELEAPIGAITSGALSPTLGYPIAMAYVEPTSASDGARLFIDVRGTRVPASVVSLPFYKRETKS
jgi:aminomethyltransferase